MIYTLPFIAAAIGWFTNWLAVKMLFHPRNKVKVLFIEFHGVFPKRQAVIAEKIAKMVTDELFSATDIVDRVSGEENIGLISERIETKIDDYLVNSLPKNHPLLALFLGKKGKSKIKEEFMREVHIMAPEVVKSYVEDIENSLDVEAIIRKRVSLLSPKRLEELIVSILKKEFQFIEYIGAVIGFLIGMVQIGLLML